MKHRYAISLSAFLLLVHSASKADEPLPPLLVESGKTKIISAQRYEFSKVEIQKDARLVVKSGAAMLHLVVKGPMKLYGVIEARSFNSDERQVTLAIAGQQTPLQLEFRNTNRGGNGGHGGAGAVNVGGQGAVGNSDAGGGGGGGGGRELRPLKDYLGKPASGEVGGGWAGGGCGAMGGNGARRSVNGNGGIVFLEVAGDFDGSGGTIDVRGDIGPRGSDGGLPQFPPMAGAGCIGGGGGGGGGAPGGQGGYVVAYVDGSIAAYPATETAGGDGGDGGAAKQEGDRSGSQGTKGQRGASGRAFWFKRP